MDEIIASFQKTYFTEFALILSLVICIIFLAKYRIRKRTDNIFLTYVVSFLLLFILDYTIRFVNLGQYRNFCVEILKALFYLVMALEVSAFGCAIETSITRNVFKRIFNKLMWLFIGASSLSYILLIQDKIEDNYPTLHYFNIAEAIVILIGSLFYYFEIFKTNKQEDSRREGDFWVITAISMYFLCTLPVSLLSPKLRDIDKKLYAALYSVIYFFYTIIFCIYSRIHYLRWKTTQSKKISNWKKLD